MSRSRTRRLAAIALVAGTLAVAGCGSSSSTSDGEPTSPPATGDATDATAAWADSVCSSLTDVKTAIGSVGDGLSVNPLGGDALDEAREQIQANLDDVRSSIDDLKSAIAAAPEGEGTQEVKAAFETAMADLESAQQAAAEQAQAAADAESVPEFLGAAAGALSAVGTAGAAVGELYTTATGEASGAGSEVRAAFASAPACQALNG